MLDDSTYSTSHGAAGVQMAVNLGSDGKRLSQETAEQRQKKITKCERKRYAKKSGRDIRAEIKMTKGRERKRNENAVTRNILIIFQVY
jgi:hypothetical protein